MSETTYAVLKLKNSDKPEFFEQTSPTWQTSVKQVTQTIRERLADQENLEGQVLISNSSTVGDYLPSATVKLTPEEIQKIAVTHIIKQVLPLINTELVMEQKPLILTGRIYDPKNNFNQILNNLDHTINHIDKFKNLADKTKQKTIFPLYNEYKQEYDLPTYTTVVLWGQILSELQKLNHLVYKDVEKAKQINLFARLAGNLEYNRIWKITPENPKLEENWDGIEKTLARIHKETFVRLYGDEPAEDLIPASFLTLPVERL